MTATAKYPLEYVPIRGRGVDALENRKEHNNNEAITAAKLRTSIDKNKQGIFHGMKMLAQEAFKKARE
jgi:hypothetical protein